jgi:hypothetical protein
MARYRSLDDILEEPDELGLLEVKLKPRGTRSPEDEKIALAIGELNEFFGRTGRLPDPDSMDQTEMRLGAILDNIRKRPDRDVFADVDIHGLLATDPADPGEEARPEGQGAPAAVLDAIPAPVRDWREDPEEDEIPASLDDIFGDDDLDLDEALIAVKNVTPAAERLVPDHRAEFYPCEDFEVFEQIFETMQAALDANEREVQPVRHNEVIEVHEGSFFIRKGLLTYVAEKAEMTARGGKRDHRLRIIFSNGTESDPLLSSFRKALADDPTARIIHRHGLGALDPDWEADKLETTGTIYVARSLSKEPQIAEVSKILHKIGVTSQDVRRRVADARNDPTFLMAPVEIVATYELKNLSRRKVEELLHRFFDAARPRDLWITDRMGKKIYPREWFYVLPEHVSRAAQAIREGDLHLLRYDPTAQNIVRMPKGTPEA